MTESRLVAALGGGGAEEGGNAKRLKVTFSKGMNIFIVFVLMMV